jgi:hypothetical protein
LPLPITATPEHPFWAVKRDDFGANARCEAYLLRKGKTKQQAVDEAVRSHAKFVPISELSKLDYLIVPIRPAAPESGEIVTDPYLLGVYLAEGCIGREYRDIPTKGKPRRVILTLHKNDDAAILEMVQKTADHKVLVEVIVIPRQLQKPTRLN